MKDLIDIFNGAVNQCRIRIVSREPGYNAFHFFNLLFYLSFSSKDFIGYGFSLFANRLCFFISICKVFREISNLLKST